MGLTARARPSKRWDRPVESTSSSSWRTALCRTGWYSRTLRRTDGVAVDRVDLAPEAELSGAVHELLAAAMVAGGVVVVILLAGDDVAPGDERGHRPLLEVEADLAVRALVAEMHELTRSDEVDLVPVVEPDGVSGHLRPRHGGPVVVILGVEQRDVVHAPEDHRATLGQPERRHVPGVEIGADSRLRNREPEVVRVDRVGVHRLVRSGQGGEQVGVGGVGGAGRPRPLP